MIRDKQWKLAFFCDPSNPERFPTNDGQTLFNLEEDPGERINLANKIEHKEIVEKLISKIHDWDKYRDIYSVS